MFMEEVDEEQYFRSAGPGHRMTGSWMTVGGKRPPAQTYVSSFS